MWAGEGGLNDTPSYLSPHLSLNRTMLLENRIIRPLID